MRPAAIAVCGLILAANPVAGAQGTSSGSAARPATTTTTTTTTTTAAARTGAAPAAGAHHATPAAEAFARAQTTLVAHNFDAAMSAYREAQSDPAFRAPATLGIGYTLSARGDRDGALSAFREATQAAVSANDDLGRVRALQAIGNLLEAMGRWSDANTAWQEFVTFVDAHPTLGNAANGRARMAAIRQRDDDERRFAVVRQRIEERRRINAAGPGGGAH